jgi:hypothetical protein
MTVAHVRPRPGDAFVEVLFLESPRIYRLPTTHPEFHRLLGLLRRVIATRRAVKVYIASLDSDVIQDVRE